MSDLSKHLDKVEVLLEALPYIKKFYGEKIVIKYGGSLASSEKSGGGGEGYRFARDLVLLKYIGAHPIVIHGGGKEITSWMEKIGKKAVFVDGLRYTDAESMEITEMVLSGKINNEIVNLINQAGGNAVGLNGKSGKLVTAFQIHSKDGKDIGLVGDVEWVEPKVLNDLCDLGFIPVISPVSASSNGTTLNLNADMFAAAIAGAMHCKKLIFMTDVNGLRIDGNYLNNISLSEAESYLNHKDVQGGMIPKLECCIRALRSGVQEVHMINGSINHSTLLELFTDAGVGTMISKYN